MKLVYVVHQFFPRFFSGTEQYVLALAKNMQARGHDVEVFTLEPLFEDDSEVFHVERDAFEGVSIVRLRYWRHVHPNPIQVEYFHPLVGRRFAEYLEERRPDMVHVFHLRYLGGNLLQEAHRLKVPVAVNLMDFWFLCPVFLLLKADGTLCNGPPDGGFGCFPCVNAELGRSLDVLGLSDPVRQLARGGNGPGTRSGDGLYSLYSAVLDRADYLKECLLLAERIIAPSHFLKSVFVENGVPESRIEVISYGLDDDRKQAIESASPRTKRIEKLTLGYVGTISHYKGVHVVVDAMKHVQGDVRLLVYGRMEDYAEYSFPLKELAEDDERIEFRGAFDRAAVGHVLSDLSLLVVPSLWYENTPFVIYEAFAAGLPVLATNLGGMAEIVGDGVQGELFERSNSFDLGTRIQRLLDEPDRLERYRSNVKTVKSITENAEEIENVYRGHAGEGVAADHEH